MNGLRVKDVNYLHINFQTQQTQVSNILGFFRHRQENDIANYLFLGVTVDRFPIRASQRRLLLLFFLLKSKAAASNKYFNITCERPIKLFPPPNVSNPGHKFNVATIIEIYSETDCFKRKMA
jgi:hypothetical protein